MEGVEEPGARPSETPPADSAPSILPQTIDSQICSEGEVVPSPRKWTKRFISPKVIPPESRIFSIPFSRIRSISRASVGFGSTNGNSSTTT